jgi:hypothetical protein
VRIFTDLMRHTPKWVKLVLGGLVALWLINALFIHPEGYPTGSTEVTLQQAAFSPLDSFVQQTFGADQSQLQATFEGNELSITFNIDDAWLLITSSNIDPWSSAHGVFCLKVAQLAQQAFARFPNIDNLKVVAMRELVDIRGNSRRSPEFMAKFSRANAATVHWDRLVYSNVPQFADQYWEDPKVGR